MKILKILKYVEPLDFGSENVSDKGHQDITTEMDSGENISEVEQVKETEEEGYIAKVHEGKKPFKCSICDYIFSQKEDFTRHIVSVHDNKKPYRCSICDFGCSKKGYLNKHIAAIHEDKK